MIALLTNSALTVFRRCPREYHFRYGLLRKAIWRADALRFGSFFHVGLNAWWAVNGDGWAKLSAAIDAVRARAVSHPGDADPFELIKAEVLLIGYTARWESEAYETIAVEKQFRLPLLEAQLGIGDGFDLGGSVDAIVWKKSGPFRLYTRNVEHKTTNQDISVGADYWRHVETLDPQVSTYMAASKALGFAPRDTLYDVIRKPALPPLKATAEASKKYTKPTKAEPVPRLYANMREHDETADEYRDRLAKDIIARPDYYYARKTIVRLEGDDDAHAADVIGTAEMIRFAMGRNAWPRSPSSCERYGRLCEYHDVCSGLTSIEDNTRYMTKTRAHEELDEE